MTTQEIIDRNKTTVMAFLEGTHSPDIEDVRIIDDTVSPDIVCHGFPGFPNGEFFDRESYKAFFRVFRESFSDMRFTVHALVAIEAFVSAHWEIHCEPAPGFDADRRGVTLVSV